jgi:hypothetical protein
MHGRVRVWFVTEVVLITWLDSVHISMDAAQRFTLSCTNTALANSVVFHRCFPSSINVCPVSHCAVYAVLARSDLFGKDLELY